MKKNMGTLDKLVRILIAVVIAVLYATGLITGVLAVVLSIIAIVLVLTSLVSFCPLYALLGLNTARHKKAG